MTEIELIDYYLDALNRNPTALPPHELDAETAAFVHTLWLLESSQSITPTLEAAIWQKALQAAESQKEAGTMHSLPNSRNGIEQLMKVAQPSDYAYEEKNAMLPSKSLNNFVRPRSASIYRFSSLAAAAVVLVLGSVLVLRIAQFKDGRPYAVTLQQATPTPIPLEKITPENVDKLTQLYSIPLESQIYTQVAFSPDNKYLAYGNGISTVDLWNVEKRQVEKKLINPFEHTYRLAFSSNSQLLAVNGGRGDVIWDITTNEKPLILPYDPNIIGTIVIAFSSDGKTLRDLVCSRRNTSSTGCTSETEYGWDVKTGKRTINIQRAAGLSGDADISPVDDLAAYGYFDGRLLTVKFSTGLDQTVFQYEGVSMDGVGFSPDGTLLVTYAQNRVFQVWDVAKGTSIFKQMLPVGTPDVGYFVLNGDNTLLAISEHNNGQNIQFWDVKNEKALSHIEGTDMKSDPFITATTFSPDGKLFVSISNDGKVRVWGVVAGS